jgi:hypothetical protein
MKIIGTIAVALASVVSATVAAAQQPSEDTSANYVFFGCKAFVEGQATTNAQLAMFGNYCSGLVHGLAGTGPYVTPPEWQSCAPSASDTRQLVRVVLTYIERRPERMHEDFRRLTMEALHFAWPCKSGSAK